MNIYTYTVLPAATGGTREVVCLEIVLGVGTCIFYDFFSPCRREGECVSVYVRLYMLVFYGKWTVYACVCL